jgi:hypothetical protein
MDRRQPGALLLVAALLVLVVTLSMTYVWDVLSAFRGSTLVYLGWLLLLVGVILNQMAERGRVRRALIVCKNTALVAGLVIIGLSILLSIWADNMFAWMPAA